MGFILLLGIWYKGKQTMLTEDIGQFILTEQSLAVREAGEAISSLQSLDKHLKNLGYECRELPFILGYLQRLVVRTSQELNVDNMVF
jgi:hypothetical protein